MTRQTWLGGVFVASGLAIVLLVLFWPGGGDSASTPTVPTPEVDLEDPGDTVTPEEADPEANNPSQVDDGSLSYVWEPRLLGGGGWVKGIEVHHTGEPLLARADVGGAFRFNRTTETWEQLLIQDRVEDPVPLDYHVDAIAIAESDPDRIYLLVGDTNNSRIRGRVLVSSDGGQNWSSSSQAVAANGNGNSRNGGERIAVSPNNPDVVWIGGSDGLLRSTDAGFTFDAVESAPRGNASFDEERGIEWVLADESFTYIGVSGEGVYQSGDDGDSWTRLWASTGRPFDAELDEAGVLWTVNQDDSMVRRFDPATGDVTVVEQLTGLRLRGLAVRPNGQDVVVLTRSEMWLSDDAGVDWRSVTPNFSCPSIPWVASYGFTLLTASSPEFDPLEPETLWIPEGFSVWSATDIVSGDPELRCRVDGIEELVVNDIVVPESNVLVVANWDRPLFHVPEGGSSEATIGPSNRFNSGWDLASTANDPQFIAAVVADHRFCCEDDGEAYQSGVSRDGGLTWEPFDSYSNGSHPPDLRFGNIAVSSSDTTNLVWLPTYNSALHYTVDGGASWTEIVLPGTEDRFNDEGRFVGGSHFQYFLRRHVLVADPVAAATFYVFQADLGLYRSEDGGASWQLIGGDGLPTGWTAGHFNARLSAVPGVEGHLLFTTGFLDEGTFPLFESTDGGVSWSALAGTDTVKAIGFGAPLEGSDEPTVYIAGTVDGVEGLYRSSDLMATWELVGTSAGGIYNSVVAVTGDPEIPGRLYVGFSGSTLMQGDPR